MTFNRPTLLLVSLAFSLTACGTSSESESKTFPKETTKEGIEAFLASGTYKEAPWVFDAAPRAAQLTHLPMVRVFFNPVAAEAISNGKSDDAPKGAMVVKELYDSSGTQVGVAVSLLAEEKSSAFSWLYYCKGPAENCALSDASEESFYGTGSNECATCHSGSIYSKLP